LYETFKFTILPAEAGFGEIDGFESVGGVVLNPVPGAGCPGY
jgi:hypothetical protein